MSIRDQLQAKLQATVNQASRALLEIMLQKQTNLAVSADLCRTNDILQLIDQVGSEICVLKLHIDIIEDFTPQWLATLRAKAKQYQFLLFEDRKYADIGKTVYQQYTGGIYRVADWATITNAHVISGPGIIAALQAAGSAKGNGLLLLAQMSSQQNLFTPGYYQQALAFAKQYREFVMGFIAQERLPEDNEFIIMTPGVSLADKTDNFDQSYVTPEQAVQERGSDVIIVGRGIVQAPDRKAAAMKYRARGWGGG